MKEQITFLENPKDGVYRSVIVMHNYYDNEPNYIIEGYGLNEKDAEKNVVNSANFLKNQLEEFLKKNE